MKPIQFLYATNIVSRRQGDAQQDLTFCMRVENLAYDKEVEVFWAGEDGVWRTLPALYQRTAGDNHEIWRAQARFQRADDGSLPGDIQFALCYRALGDEYWDNNQYSNYAIAADAGAQLAPDMPLLVIDFNPTLCQGQRFYPITVAVRHSVCPKQVYLHWTTDHWRTTRITPCFFKRKHWDKSRGGKTLNPNRYDCGIWISQLDIDDAYRLEYAIACQTDTQLFWDNNFNENYLARRARFKALTLNLHCYQEENQDAKFMQIAKAIADLDIDIVCLQEVGERWNGGGGDWNSNAAKIIGDRLPTPYHLYTDWSHIGFDEYREGVAILSRYPFLAQGADYVSSSQDIRSIHARKVVMVEVRIPYVGLVNVFSAHLSWWSDGFLDQFQHLHEWAAHSRHDNVAATLVCGDFNSKAGSEGYMAVIDRGYEDQFLKATARPVFDLFLDTRQGRLLDEDGRIDYIFMKTGGRLEAVAAGTLFTDDRYGRVSDHWGYYVEFEPMASSPIDNW